MLRKIVAILMFCLLPLSFALSAEQGILVQKKGDTLVLRIMPVLFEFTKADIRPSQLPTLDTVVHMAKQYSHVSIVVAGHTDTSGSRAYNQALSEQRAKNVADYLISHGVSSKRIIIHAHGENLPRFSNATLEGRRLNRRTEMNTPPLTMPRYFDGFYLGLGGGVTHTTGDLENESMDQINMAMDGEIDIAGLSGKWTLNSNSLIKNNLNKDAGETSLAGNVFAGFGRTFLPQHMHSAFYIGIEGFARYNPTEINTKHNQENNAQVTGTYDDGTNQVYFSANTAITSIVSIETKNDFSFGAIGRIGYVVNPRTMIYLLGGFDYSRFHVNVDHNISMQTSGSVNSNPLPTMNASASYDYSFHRDLFGVMPGVGIETMLTDKLSLRAQYVYSYFGKFSHTQEGIATSGTLATGSTTGIKIDNATYSLNNASSKDKITQLSRGLFTLDLTYHFNGI